MCCMLWMVLPDCFDDASDMSVTCARWLNNNSCEKCTVCRTEEGGGGRDKKRLGWDRAA